VHQVDGRKNSTRAEAQSRFGRLRRRKAAPPVSTDLRLAALERRVAPVLGRDNPLVASLLSEDTCWQIAREDWQRRKPRPWRFDDRRTWRAEGAVLEDKRDRLREQATELGITSSSSETKRGKRSPRS
jgi:hypothetical protein